VTTTLSRIAQAGLSIWLDDLSRERFDPLAATSLQRLMQEKYVVGVTTNPAIFSAAISQSNLYHGELSDFARKGLSTEDAIRRLIVSDVQQASDLFINLFETSNGADGRVSIEVDPELARDADQTIDQGIALWNEVGRENVLIKVPATPEGLIAIEELTRRGISVNVTLIFTAQRYDLVIDAYLRGLERRIAAGESIDKIHSVASFFVSRIDTEIDARLKEGTEVNAFTQLCGRAGVANALVAYQLFHDRMKSERWQKLSQQGANLQRPLWASTGVKDPAYPATFYVESLVIENSVNTMPQATLDAVAKLAADHHFEVVSPSSQRIDEANEHLSRLKDFNIDINLVGEKLESEGLEKFIAPWRSLHEKVRREFRQ
jgi:transaldolase